jgi:enoyl-CoA hydratase
LGEKALEEALDEEYRIGLRLLAGHDFREGIRAQVIDKDRNPRWNPATFPEMTQDMVDACFASLGERELGLAAAIAVP